jgi:hypothetical protein
MKKIIKKINIVVFFCFVFLVFGYGLYNMKYLYKLNYKNKVTEKTFTISEENKNKFASTRKLAYLGLNQFVNGLDKIEFQEEYNSIFQGDEDVFEEKVFDGTLSTATPALIKGTLDFLAQKLQKRLNLIVNDVLLASSCVFFNNSIDLKMRNNNNDHFFIFLPHDTTGDGYCFFHAIIFLLKEKVPSLEKIINDSFEKIDLITTNQKIIDKIEKQKKIREEIQKT